MKEDTAKNLLWIIVIGALLMFPLFLFSSNLLVTFIFLFPLTLFYRWVGWVEGGNKRFPWE
jgi:hypothetical protein